MMYIVYTEIHNFDNHTVERWFYGAYDTKRRADNVAYELGQDHYNGIFHSWCTEDEAESYGIRNMWH